MKIIFLDIDGVLLTSFQAFNNHNIKLNEKCLKNLSDIVFSTDSHIVVSSSLRVGPRDSTDHFWESFLNNLELYGLREKIIDVTPVIYLDTFENPRGLEIKEWLKNHNEVTAFVIIDDNDIKEFTDTNLAKCDSYIGIDTAVKEKAITILNGSAFQKNN